MTRDLLFQDEIRELVREAYRGIPAGAGAAMARRLYDADELARVPETAVRWSLGVGNPVRHAGIAPGEVVLDLGCGGGIDSVLAALLVGETGRVIGVDLLPEMCRRAGQAARLADVGWRCEFRQGEMESLPLEDAEVDVVISNGAVNLSPRKSRVLAEVWRVLRPGGRLCLADLAVEQDLPPEVLASDAAWAGCVAGAVSERVLRAKLARLGFDAIEVDGHQPFGVDDVAAYPLFDDEVLDLMRRLIPAEARRRVAVALTLQARKPTARLETATGGAVDATRVRRLADVAPDRVEAPGVVVRHLKSVEDVDLKVLDVEAGGSTPYHTHTHAHEGVVVSGTGALRLADDTVPLAPGDVFTVRPSEPHAVESHGAAVLRFVCMDCLV